MFKIYVNGNEVHDEGEHDAQGRVVRSGGGPLEFATKAEGERFADARHAADVALSRPKNRPSPKRESYVVSEMPPTSD
jgi:hypothetical protein